MEKEFHDRAELCEILGLKPPTLEAMIRRGEVKYELQSKSFLDLRMITRFTKEEVFRLKALLTEIKSLRSEIKKNQEKIKRLIEQKKAEDDKEKKRSMNKLLNEEKDRLRKAKEKLEILNKRKKDGK